MQSRGLRPIHSPAGRFGTPILPDGRIRRGSNLRRDPTPDPIDGPQPRPGRPLLEPAVVTPANPYTRIFVVSVRNGMPIRAAAFTRTPPAASSAASINRRSTRATSSRCLGSTIDGLDSLAARSSRRFAPSSRPSSRLGIPATAGPSDGVRTGASHAPNRIRQVLRQHLRLPERRWTGTPSGAAARARCPATNGAPMRARGRRWSAQAGQPTGRPHRGTTAPTAESRAAAPQRRHDQRRPGDAVVEIAPDPPVADVLSSVRLVAAANHVDRALDDRPEAADAFRVEHAQRLRLRPGRALADLVQEHRPPSAASISPGRASCAPENAPSRARTARSPAASRTAHRSRPRRTAPPGAGTRHAARGPRSLAARLALISTGVSLPPAPRPARTVAAISGRTTPPAPPRSAPATPPPPGPAAGQGGARRHASAHEQRLAVRAVVRTDRHTDPHAGTSDTTASSTRPAGIVDATLVSGSSAAISPVPTQPTTSTERRTV